MATFDSSRVIPAFDALAQHMRAIELPPSQAFHVTEANLPTFETSFQEYADQRNNIQNCIAVLRRAWTRLVPFVSESECAGGAMPSAASSLSTDAARPPHAVHDAQIENSSHRIAQLQKQLQDLTSEHEAENERARIEIARLRLRVAETEALLSAAPHSSTPSHSNFAHCSGGILAGKRRRNEQFLRELFDRLKDSSGGLCGQNLVQALRDADAPIIPACDQEIADVLKQFDANSDGILDFGEFQAAVSEPDELQIWFGEKQLPLAADALRALVGRCSDQLKVFSLLSAADIERAAAATCSVIPGMLRELHRELQGAFAIQSQIEADMKADPSKFNDFFQLACGKIADFHKGLTGRVGMPHLDFKKAMRQEHCERAGCDVEFTTGNYKITTKPKSEWQYVVDGVACADMGHQRRLIPISELLQRKVCLDAGLREEEVIAVVLYTGPMFQIYNTILRRYPEDKYSVFRDGDNLFSTTIFVLVSAVQKLSRFTRIPCGTLLYRGLGGKMDLPDIFFQIDDQGCSGYAEWGFLSTTSDRDVALGYSGVKERRRKAMVMVIETSSIDRGADISELSQYPGEKEFLYLPCSFVQRTRQGNGRVQVVDGGLVAFFSVKVNLNIKTQTVEELQEQKKSMHMVSARSMLAEVKYMFSEWTQAMCDQGFDPADISSVVAENVEACQHIVEIHDQRGVVDYADDELFRAMINEVLDTKARVIRNKNNRQIKLKHMVSARSMVAEAELHVMNWAARCRLQGIDLSQYVGDVCEFRDGLMAMCQRLIAKHEQRDSGDFADVDNLQTLKRELDIVVDATKWQETRMQLRSHEFEAATCVATLEGHSDMAFSVAFHPTAPLLATGSHDKTVKLWRLSSVNSSATCVATLEGHSKNVKSVAFHPTAPLLATGSSDNTVKLWRLSSDNSSATCVATLEGHSSYVFSVAFHPTAPFLATGSGDATAKLWRLSSGNSSATFVATLEGHSGYVRSVSFHPTAPLLGTGSEDKTAKLWRLSSDNSSATCVATLEGHSTTIWSVSFHPTAPLLATGSGDKTAKLWRLSSDNSSATCVATLEGHNNTVASVAFHPTAPLLATGGLDNIVKLWRLSSDKSSTCVATLEGCLSSVRSVAFHPTAPLLATGSDDGIVKLWR